MNIFLYDYCNSDSEVVLFGYDESSKKCEIKLGGFSICCDLVIDLDYFESAVAM